MFIMEFSDKISKNTLSHKCYAGTSNYWLTIYFQFKLCRTKYCIRHKN